MRLIEIYADTRGVNNCNGAHCGKRILWAVVVKSGKRMCFNDPELPALKTRLHEHTRRLIEAVDLDANHWATCPDARKFDDKPKTPRDATRTHKCYISYCNKTVPETYLMCPTHWGKVSPKNMQAVWKWYRAKATGTDAERANADEQHLNAIEIARAEVEGKESGSLFRERPGDNRGNR